MTILARLWSLRRDRPVFVAVSFLAVAALLVYPAVDSVARSAGIAQPWNYQDFNIYRIAVADWEDGNPLYPDDGEGFWGQYLYPPVFLVLFRPFMRLSPDLAGLAWGVTSVGLLWIALQLVVSRLGVPLRWWERLLGIWLLVGFHPLLLSLKLGQTGGFLAAVLAFALAGVLADGHPDSYLSGAMTAVVGTFKLAYAPVGAHLLADRTRFLGAAVAGLALLGFSVAVFGVGTHLAYLDVLAWGLERGSGARLPKPHLLHDPYYRQLSWFPAELAVRLGIAAVVALAAGLARNADHEVFALGTATFLLITPLPYVYYFVAALPAVLLLVAVELERGGYPAVPVVALLLLQAHTHGLRLLASGLPRLLGELPDVAYPILQPGLWGVLLLFGLTGHRVRQAVVVPAPLRERVLRRSRERERADDRATDSD